MKKNLNLSEIRDKIIKYLKSKDINIITKNYCDLVWEYEKYYSKFNISLKIMRCNTNKPEEDDKYIIKYFTSSYPTIQGIRRRRTSANGSFCKSVYDNLMWISSELDKIAEEQRTKIDTKKKYCTELELHYKEIHNNVSVTIDKLNGDNDDTFNISVRGSDDNNKITIYDIVYKDNRYYLKSKFENVVEILN